MVAGCLPLAITWRYRLFYLGAHQISRCDFLFPFSFQARRKQYLHFTRFDLSMDSPDLPILYPAFGNQRGTTKSNYRYWSQDLMDLFGFIEFSFGIELVMCF